MLYILLLIVLWLAIDDAVVAHYNLRLSERALLYYRWFYHRPTVVSLKTHSGGWDHDCGPCWTTEDDELAEWQATALALKESRKRRLHRDFPRGNRYALDA